MSSKTGGRTAPITWASRADAEAVADRIDAIIRQPGHHWIAVPGGRTPLPIFNLLSQRELPWNTVSLMLTDDRLVPVDHPASNQGKLEAAFRSTGARVAKLDTSMSLPFYDLVWLGVGEDGHIASLFPNGDPTVEGEAAIILTRPEPLPPEAPFERLSLNLPALTNTKEIILVAYGSAKKRVLDDALGGASDLPIARLLSAARCPVTIFWS